MIAILDWIFEGIITWVASIVSLIMDAISGMFLEALGTDMTVMEEYFPFVARAFEVMQYTAWCILFLITVWQLVRAFGGPITESENPWHLAVRSALFAFLIGYAKPIFNTVLDVARAPYTALMDAGMNPGDFTFAGIENVLMTGMVSLLSVASIVGLLLILILMICLEWNYFKTLLLVVERYIVVGVLCYTSPLAYAVGGSKATSRVFQSWCRMVGAQLILLVMNVWFLRAFNSSVGQFVASGGALSTGGSIFLWLFCALAFLKTAQKFDSLLASMGLSVAQSGGNMGMELLLAARVLGGFGRMPSTAGRLFGGAGAAAGSAGAAAGSAGAAGAADGVMAGFASKFKGNSYVRDAAVEGGSRMGASGGIGFVGRAFGGMAARTGSTLTGESISSVAARHPSVSGSIGGDIANRSLANYMPHLSGRNLSGTQITGGQISATAAGTDGKEAYLQMFNASQYDRPAAPHTVVKASDGSTWYQTASGEGMSSFYSPAATFMGDASEAALVSSEFPEAPEGTVLRSVDDGVIEATNPDGSNSVWYNGAIYSQPDAPHDTIASGDGVIWYSMQPHAGIPNFEAGGQPGGSDTHIITDRTGGTASDSLEATDSARQPDPLHPFWAGGMAPGSGAQGYYEEIPLPASPPPGAYPPGSGGIPFGARAPDSYEIPLPTPPSGGAYQADSTPAAAAGATDSYQIHDSTTLPGGAHFTETRNYDATAASGYNLAQFHQFMPGYGQQVSGIDSSRQTDGVLEVRHSDGSGTAIYDSTMYKQPRGEHRIYEDSRGGSWYAVPGTPTVERRPVYENGKPVYDGDQLRTANVEGMRYKTTPERFAPPKKRDIDERKPPRRK